MLTPAARTLLLGVGLVMAGTGAIAFPIHPTPSKRPAYLAILRAGLADRTAFLTFALAARTAHPALAAIGACAASVLLTTAALSFGPGAWHRLPLRAFGLAAGILLLVPGIILILLSLRLL